MYARLCEAILTFVKPRSRSSQSTKFPSIVDMPLRPEFQGALAGYGMRSSMSSKGNCWDNAPTERLAGRKVGRLYGKRFASRGEAMDEVMDWLTFFIHRRLNSTSGHVSPMTFEQRCIAAQQQDRKSAHARPMECG